MEIKTFFQVLAGILTGDGGDESIHPALYFFCFEILGVLSVVTINSDILRKVSI